MFDSFPTWIGSLFQSTCSHDSRKNYSTHHESNLCLHVPQDRFGVPHNPILSYSLTLYTTIIRL